MNSNPTPMSCAVSNGAQVAKITFAAIAYILVIVLYVFVHDLGVSFYKERMGGFTTRGVAIGITAELMFGFFIFINERKRGLSLIFYKGKFLHERN